MPAPVEDIPGLTTPNAARYLGFMVPTHGYCFFYFTTTGAALSPSGVGSVL